MEKRSETPDSPAGGRRLQEGILVMFLLVISVIPYLQTLKFGFVNYDDPMHVSAQASVLAGINSESVGWATTATPGNLWHPLTWISYMAEVQWAGGGADSPGVHHGGNLVLYLATIAVFYLLVRALGVAMLPASLGVLLFALHPLHAEPVAWISARKDLLSGAFVLTSILAYVLSGRAGDRAQWKWRAVSLVTFALALLSKPSVVVLPLLLVLLDWYPLRRGGFQNTESASETPSPGTILKSQLRSKWPYFAMAFVAAIVALSVQGGGTHRDFASESSLVGRLGDAPGHLAFYFQRLLWPANLMFEYPRPFGNGALLYTITGLALAIGMSCLAWTWRRRFPEVMLGWVWTLLLFAPVLGLVYIGDSYTADRYWYLALAGPVLAVVFLLGRLGSRHAGSVALAAVLLLALGAASYKQTRVWKNDHALFHHAVEVNPKHLTALGNLGSYYRVQKDDEQALKYYLAALEVNPRDHIVHYNIAHIRNNQGDREGSIAACRGSLDGYPNYARAHHLLGVLLADPSHRDTYDPEEALVHLKRAYDLDPREPRHAINLVYNLHLQGRREEAKQAINQALQTFPPDSKVSRQLEKWLREINQSTRAYGFNGHLTTLPPFASLDRADLHSGTDGNPGAPRISTRHEQGQATAMTRVWS